MKNKLEKMFEMQDKFNCIVNEEWRLKSYEWHRAAYVEAVEAIDHHGWKWWGGWVRNEAQRNIELVDIFKFMISQIIEASAVLYAGIDSLIESYEYKFSSKKQFDFISSAESLMLDCLSATIIEPYLLFEMMKSVDMDFDELYLLFIGKHQLNVLRQSEGYAGAAYKKIWNGEEDNAALYRICKGLDADAEGVDDYIYEELEKAYQLVKEAA